MADHPNFRRQHLVSRCAFLGLLIAAIPASAAQQRAQAIGASRSLAQTVTLVPGAARGASVASSQRPFSSVASASSAGASVAPLTTTCSPEWLPTFGDQPGTNADVYSMNVFDDGGGPALFVGGRFTVAGSIEASRIVKRDASGWHPLGLGVAGPALCTVRALCVFDDGGGPALYAGGDFTSAGGVAAARIAKWNGSSWSALGSGLNSDVFALRVFDDGGGPRLYAGGAFTTAGGVAAAYVARWDGTSWSSVGGGMSSSVLAFEVFDDGSGSALHAGGYFATSGGVATNRIAKWNGTGWSALAGGVTGTGFIEVLALSVFDDGSGPALFAGGKFASAGGVAADNISRWNGSSWSPLGTGTNVRVQTLSVFDDGSGAALYAGGGFNIAGGSAAVGLAKWDGALWSALGAGVDASVFALASFDDGSGPALFAGGQIYNAGANAANRIARWNGAAWSSLGSGIDRAVLELHVHDDGSGPALYVGGSLQSVGGARVSGIGRWDGVAWTALGLGVGGSVRALTTYDDGAGPALIAGGAFFSAGGSAANNVASWDGSSWSPLGSGVSGGSFISVSALAVFDDGTGPALIAGGTFFSAGGSAVDNIASWDGSSWSPLGGVAGAGAFSSVSALVVFDDGSGPALYVGGNFTFAGSGAANYIARWNGTSWSALGTGMNGPVTALAVFDDGGGPALFAGGNFTLAGGLAANPVAKWNGSSWSALSSGTNDSVSALAVFDDGGGPALYAGGYFTASGGGAANRIAKWDGTTWSALASVMDDYVAALTVFDDGTGAALHVGGAFSVSPVGDSFLARWACPFQITGTAFCFGDGTQSTPCPCLNTGAAGHGCANSTNPLGALLTASGTTQPDTAVLFGTGMPASVSAIYLKGDQDNGTGAVFGDGVRCADGSLVRLRTKLSVGGASQFPDSTDTISLSVRGGTPPGSGLTGHYQVSYRNAASLFCPPATFNMSNGFRITW